MTGALAGLALAGLAYAYLRLLLRDPAPGRHRGQLPPESSQPDSCDASTAPASAESYSPASGWLPATLPAALTLAPPWRPRICAGRVASIAAARAVFDKAGYLLVYPPAGVRWLAAPEGFTA